MNLINSQYKNKKIKSNFAVLEARIKTMNGVIIWELIHKTQVEVVWLANLYL